jgi:putative N-acetyltransferase (TIGR04045 family)
MPLLGETDFLAPAPFLAGEYRIEAARHGWQMAGCYALRRQVFCIEQGIFPHDDRDEIDRCCTLLTATSCMFGHDDEIVGTVRINQPEPGLWWGSRLAVAAPFRRVGGLGAALIRLAVGTAKSQGAETFLAHVQAQNAKLFEAMDWRRLDDTMIHGRPHYLMQADLAAYEPLGGVALRVLPPPRRSSP